MQILHLCLDFKPLENIFRLFEANPKSVSSKYFFSKKLNILNHLLCSYLQAVEIDRDIVFIFKTSYFHKICKIHMRENIDKIIIPL